MTAIILDPRPEQGEILDLLYAGDLVLFTGLAAVQQLVDFARDQLIEIFSPYDPQEAHLHFSPEDAAAILAKWKPAFMREPRSKELLQAIVEQAGFSPNDTHIDLLKPRTAFPVGHLTTGIAFAFPWHRDTWYAAPAQQINWWLPIFDLSKTNAMKFDFAQFSAPISNTSEGFDYYQINRDRLKTASQTKVETQSRPSALSHDPDNVAIILPKPGSILLFSGTHLHATIPNESGRSRYSIDFRTVYRRDVLNEVGAPIVDARCTGTSIRDFVNMASGEPFEESLVRQLYGNPPSDAVLVFSSETD
jgi:hypothetical protein